MRKLAALGYVAVVVLLISAPKVLANSNVTCNGTMSNVTTDNVVVPSGGVCRLNFATVKGSVTVEQNAYFEASQTTVLGDLTAANALTVFLRNKTSVAGSVNVVATQQLFVYQASVHGPLSATNAVAPGFGHAQVCGSQLGGGVEVSGIGPDVLIGDPAAGCDGNVITGPLSVTGSSAATELAVAGNKVAGNISVLNNLGAGPKKVQDNTSTGGLSCLGNDAPFTGEPNGPVVSSIGQCA
jgi:hypothetical protein